jgi:hypothetical protein
MTKGARGLRNSGALSDALDFVRKKQIGRY